MAIERTLSIIKPDATRRNLTGAIVQRLEDAGLRVVAQKRLRLSRAQAEGFYQVHAERPFYESLCAFMSSGAVVVQVLEGEGAIAKYREVMGATNPADAAPGTIRADFTPMLAGFCSSLATTHRRPLRADAWTHCRVRLCAWLQEFWRDAPVNTDLSPRSWL